MGTPQPGFPTGDPDCYASPTPTGSSTATNTPTASNTPTETLTPTITSTATDGPTPTNTNTPEPTETVVPTATETVNPTASLTYTPTPSATSTPDPCPNWTYSHSGEKIIWTIINSEGSNSYTLQSLTIPWSHSNQGVRLIGVEFGAATLWTGNDRYPSSFNPTGRRALNTPGKRPGRSALRIFSCRPVQVRPKISR